MNPINDWIKWFHIESPQSASESKMDSPPSTENVKNVLGKVWGLCRPDATLLFASALFMVRVRRVASIFT